jgi:hypothetical protein
MPMVNARYGRSSGLFLTFGDPLRHPAVTVRAGRGAQVATSTAVEVKLA